tara:strand:+ start:678 stop:1112 length:435 start_codon:yes stop_codon:yes gene_type:complete
MKGLIATFMLSFGGLLYYTYDNLEYKGYPSTHNCTGECYEAYVKIHGTPAEIEVRKRLAAEGDPFSSIKGLWAGCAACHGNEGQGMGVFPKLAGQNADYISGRLYQYKNNETVGNMSSTMWAQAGMLSDSDIDTLSKFIEETMK